MKLYDDIEDQRLSLNITPLIDIVFLLVLFFAVTTSFISPQALGKLKEELSGLLHEKHNLHGKIDDYEKKLENAIAAHQKEISDLEAALMSAQGKKAKSEWKIDALEKYKEHIRKSLEEKKGQTQSLKEQLEQAYKDYQTLNVRLVALKDSNEQMAATEELLRAKISQLEVQAAEHRKVKDEIQIRLEKKEAQNRNLKGQIDISNKKYQTLNVQQTDMKNFNEQMAATEELLRDKISQLENEITKFSRDKEEIWKSLVEEKKKNRSLNQQLAQAGKVHQTLNVQYTALINSKEQMAATDELLRAKISQLEKEIVEFSKDKEEIRKNLVEEKKKTRSLNQQLEQADKIRKMLTGQYTSLIDSNEQTAATEELLRVKISKLESDLAKYKKSAMLESEQTERLSQAQRTLRSGLSGYIAQKKLGIKLDQKRIILQLSDQILFDSGSEIIKPNGLEVLKRLGNILHPKMDQFELQICGHTDNVPIKYSKKTRFSNNWELSAARAVSVVNFFVSDMGLPPARMSAMGYGEHRPIASNENIAGRARNRRIEIVIVPR